MECSASIRYSASRAASAMRAVTSTVTSSIVPTRPVGSPAALRDGRHVDARPAVDAGDDAHVERGALAQRARAAELADEALAVLGGDALQPRRAVEDLGGHVEDLAQALVGVGQPAVLGDGEDADRRGEASVRKRSSLWASACSAARRSPMSAICERKYCGPPSALRTTVTCSATHASPPSARR